MKSLFKLQKQFLRSKSLTMPDFDNQRGGAILVAVLNFTQPHAYF
jgi:hypothetical protein